MDHLLSKDALTPDGLWAAEATSAPSPTRDATLAPHGGSDPSDRLMVPPPAAANCGGAGEPTDRIGRRTDPDPAGCGARQARPAPPPGQRPVGATDTQPTRRAPGPPGSREAVSPRLSDNSVVRHTTKCGSGINHLHERGPLRIPVGRDARESDPGLTGKGKRSRGGPERRETRRAAADAGPTPRPPWSPYAAPVTRGGRDAGSAWSSTEGHGGDA